MPLIFFISHPSSIFLSMLTVMYALVIFSISIIVSYIALVLVPSLSLCAARTKCSTRKQEMYLWPELLVFIPQVSVGDGVVNILPAPPHPNPSLCNDEAPTLDLV